MWAASVQQQFEMCTTAKFKAYVNQTIGLLRRLALFELIPIIDCRCWQFDHQKGPENKTFIWKTEDNQRAGAAGGASGNVK